MNILENITMNIENRYVPTRASTAQKQIKDVGRIRVIFLLLRII